MFKGILDELAYDGVLSLENVRSLNSNTVRLLFAVFSAMKNTESASKARGPWATSKRMRKEWSITSLGCREDAGAEQASVMLQRRRVSGTGKSDCTAIPQNFVLYNKTMAYMKRYDPPLKNLRELLTPALSNLTPTISIYRGRCWGNTYAAGAGVTIITIVGDSGKFWSLDK
jgi:hypothetical protein